MTQRRRGRPAEQKNVEKQYCKQGRGSVMYSSDDHGEGGLRVWWKKEASEKQKRQALRAMWETSKRSVLYSCICITAADPSPASSCDIVGVDALGQVKTPHRSLQQRVATSKRPVTIPLHLSPVASDQPRSINRTARAAFLFPTLSGLRLNRARAE